MGEWDYTWQRLAASGAPSGRRRATSRCTEKFPEEKLQAKGIHRININSVDLMSLNRD